MLLTVIAFVVGVAIGVIFAKILKNTVQHPDAVAKEVLDAVKPK